jgi:acyl-CoA thioesterase-1
MDKPVVVCFGDSLTAGHGATVPGVDDREHAYPAYLQRRLAAQVVNAGVSGDTTFDALARIERDVLAWDPAVVIIEFGANDLFQRISPKETQENFEKMIALLTRGAARRDIYAAKFYTETVAREMTHIIGIDGYAEQTECIRCYDALFDSLSSKASLITDIWTGVWGRFMSDALHPNARGYEIMAGRCFTCLHSQRLFQ